MTSDAIVLRSALAVLGTGSDLPGPALTTTELVRRATPYLPAGAPALALRIAKRLNIQARHMVRSFHETQELARETDSGPKMAARAIRAARAEAGSGAPPPRMLLGHTTTPHTLLPSNIAWVAQELDHTGAHLELRQACTGFAAATVLSASLSASGIGPIAVVGSEAGSVFLDTRHVSVDRSQLINLVQMGDGAGAIVFDALRHAGAARVEFVFYGSLPGHRLPGISLTQGGAAQPHSQAGRTAHFAHDFEAIRRHGLALLRAGFDVACDCGVAPSDVAWWIVHPANGRMADYVASALGIPAERVICEASQLGNLGSAAIWVALDRLRRSARLVAGDRVVVLGAEASKYMYGGLLYVHGPTRQ